MNINRNYYLNKLIAKKHNGLVKIITGLRRAGKSYLLFKLFKEHLLSSKVLEDQIITFAFDNKEDLILLDDFLPNSNTLFYDSKKINYKVNSNKFLKYLLQKTKDDKKYYILLDEIQLLDEFVITLNALLRHSNFDIYVTGSNSKMLSKDILTEFRGRGDQIHLYPLSFKEFYSVCDLDFNKAYLEYSYYGGMPYLLSISDKNEKQEYLKRLFTEIYLKDIIDRNNIQNKEKFTILFEILASQIGSYTNPCNIENTFKSKLKIVYNHDTIKNHIDFMIDSFILSEVKKYDIKGKKYIGANSKYYYTDIGLRNALLNFRQIEPTHIMENIIYNELLQRGYSVDVGVVELNEKDGNGKYYKKQFETDFICNKLDKKIYIQAAYSIDNIEKFNQEKKLLINIKDYFKKVIIVKDEINKYFTDEGVEVVSLKDFLLESYDLI